MLKALLLSPTSLFFAAALASSLPAQTSQYTLLVGGPNSIGCQNSTVPPTLSDGITVATAELEFRYDSSTGLLQLEARNTSPVDPGVPNPVIAELGFGVPAHAVDNVTLVGQSAAGGAAPAFSDSFEIDTTVQPNPNKMGCLGNFNVLLEASQGGIANPDADTWMVPAAGLTMGPATFDLQLAGPGIGLLSARTIALNHSQLATASSVNAGVKFMSGGVAGASGLISSDRGECLGNLWVDAPAAIGTSIELCASSAAGCHGCLLVSLDPGPTVIGPIVAPIGLPVLLTVVFPVFPNAPVCAPVRIPDDARLVGTSIYMTVATTGMPVNFSPQFELQIVQ